MGRLIGKALVGVLALAIGASPQAASSPILQRFLSLDDPDASQFRALRHLEAQNDHFDSSARMDVWTDADATGFRYQVVFEEGSDYIRSRVFRRTLDTERAMWGGPTSSRAAFTTDNYTFAERGTQSDGLTSLAVTARRKDILLVDGSIFLNPEDGELVKMEGNLAKAPSFWTRHVAITRWYKRFAGVRLPVAVESTANVRIAGRSTFRMTYEYEYVNGQRVGSPRAATTP